MCGTCGCPSGAMITLLAPDRPVPAWLGGGRLTQLDRGPADHGHRHPAGLVPHLQHSHDQEHGHAHVVGTPETTRTVELQQKVLAKNDDLADANRQWLRDRSILAVNLMSSPGAGKTTLLERTSKELAGRLSISVIEGDQETALDAKRIQAAGSRVVQINTGVGCHLDADMVAQGLRGLDRKNFALRLPGQNRNAAGDREGKRVRRDKRVWRQKADERRFAREVILIAASGASSRPGASLRAPSYISAAFRQSLSRSGPGDAS